MGYKRNAQSGTEGSIRFRDVKVVSKYIMTFFSKDIFQIQTVAILIVVAGLIYYALKRTGYIEGLETKTEDKDKDEDKHTKTTSTKIKTIIN